MPTSLPASTLPTPLRAPTTATATTATEKASQAESASLLELPVRLELRRSDDCRVRRPWSLPTASAVTTRDHCADDSNPALDIPVWSRTPVRHTVTMPVDSDTYCTRCTGASHRVFACSGRCDGYDRPHEQSYENGVVLDELDELRHFRQCRSITHNVAMDCSRHIDGDGHDSVSDGEGDDNVDNDVHIGKADSELPVPRAPVPTTSTFVASSATVRATAARPTPMAPPSTLQPRRRVRLLYRDEAVRTGFCENAQRLIASVQQCDSADTTTSALLARKALRYRRVSLERVGRVDTRDPAFDVSAFFGVEWSKA